MGNVGFSIGKVDDFLNFSTILWAGFWACIIQVMCFAWKKRLEIREEVIELYQKSLSALTYSYFSSFLILDFYITKISQTSLSQLKNESCIKHNSFWKLSTAMKPHLVTKRGVMTSICASVTNVKDNEQPFTYLVQIQDRKGVTISLSWINDRVLAGQTIKSSLPWVPTQRGLYIAQIFVWQSIESPKTLSYPCASKIAVA